MRVRVNFGARSFVYAEGSKHRVAADLWSDSLEDIREGFIELPFALEPDEDDKKDGQTLSKVSKPSPPKPAPLTIPKDGGKGLWLLLINCFCAECIIKYATKQPDPLI